MNDTNQLFVSNGDTINIWNIENKEKVKEIAKPEDKEHLDSIGRKMCVIKNSNRLISSAEEIALVWNLETLQLETQFSKTSLGNNFLGCFSGNGKLLA